MFLFGLYRQCRHWNYCTFKLLSVMPKPVFLMTVQEAHKEYNSLTDKIRAKYKQLDSGEFGSPGTLAFDAEACELANFAQNWICRLQRNYTGPRSSSIEDAFGSKLQAGSLFRVWRMQLCSHRYVRITRLLRAPLVLRIGDWLCVMPAIPLVVWQVQGS